MIIANWKMNLSMNQAMDLCQNIDDDVIIAAPAPYLGQLTSKFPNRKFASQDVSTKQGYDSFTGEISADMLAELNIRYSIVGHSERRTYFSESNEIVMTKAKNCSAAGIIPIICIGEEEETRKNGTYLDHIKKQIMTSIPNSCNYILAYEPIWSIGTGKAATASEINEIFSFLKEFLIAKPMALVYGGSINSNNVSDIMSVKEIDGLLIGKSSLNSAELNEIVTIWRQKLGEV